MAVATGTAILIAAAVAAAGTAYTVREQNMTGKRMATIAGQQAHAQAKTLEMQAQAERTQAEVDELDRQRTLDRIMSAQNAVFGASGLATTSGSFTNIQTTDAARAAEAKRLNQVFTDTRQVGFRNNIRQIQDQAAITRSAAKVARRTNTVRGFTQILSSGASAYADSQSMK
jgi:hypothetical protein